MKDNRKAHLSEWSKSTFSIEQWREQIELKVDRMRRDSSQFRQLERFGLVEVKTVGVKFYFEKHGK